MIVQDLRPDARAAEDDLLLRQARRWVDECAHRV